MTETSEINAFLLEDLKQEYEHWHFYMQSAYSVRGVHNRQELKSFFLKEAADEMKHIEEFGELIMSHDCLFNTPFTYQISSCTDAQTLLERTIDLEQEAAVKYAGQLDLVEKMPATVYTRHVRLFLESQMQDSYQTSLEAKTMLDAHLKLVRAN